MALIPCQQKEIDEGRAVIVVVQPGASIQGTIYFKETNLLVSPGYARHLVETGAARYP